MHTWSLIFYGTAIPAHANDPVQIRPPNITFPIQNPNSFVANPNPKQNSPQGKNNRKNQNQNGVVSPYQVVNQPRKNKNPKNSHRNSGKNSQKQTTPKPVSSFKDLVYKTTDRFNSKNVDQYFYVTNSMFNNSTTQLPNRNIKDPDTKFHAINQKKDNTGSKPLKSKQAKTVPDQGIVDHSINIKNTVPTTTPISYDRVIHFGNNPLTIEDDHKLPSILKQYPKIQRIFPVFSGIKPSREFPYTPDSSDHSISRSNDNGRGIYTNNSFQCHVFILYLF